jgi:hypothetical protein
VFTVVVGRIKKPVYEPESPVGFISLKVIAPEADIILFEYWSATIPLELVEALPPVPFNVIAPLAVFTVALPMLIP